jgi:hypothetical protein
LPRFDVSILPDTALFIFSPSVWPPRQAGRAIQALADRSVLRTALRARLPITGGRDSDGQPGRPTSMLFIQAAHPPPGGRSLRSARSRFRLSFAPSSAGGQNWPVCFMRWPRVRNIFLLVPLRPAVRGTGKESEEKGWPFFHQPALPRV